MGPIETFTSIIFLAGSLILFFIYILWHPWLEYKDSLKPSKPSSYLKAGEPIARVRKVTESTDKHGHKQLEVDLVGITIHGTVEICITCNKTYVQPVEDEEIWQSQGFCCAGCMHEYDASIQSEKD
jgi:hypothetical protein